MPEKSSPTAIFYGSAKTEQHTVQPKKEQPKPLQKVQTAVDAYIDKIGPYDTEKRFLKAHENILKSMPEGKKKLVFEKSVDAWRRAGKVAGVAATVVDFALFAHGISMSYKYNRIDLIATNKLSDFISDNDYRWQHGIKKELAGTAKKIFPYVYGEPYPNGAHFFSREQVSSRFNVGDRIIANIPLAGALMTAAIRPAHMVGNTIADIAETIGKNQAKSLNKQSLKQASTPKK